MTSQHPGKIWREIIEEADVRQTWVAARIGVTGKHLNQILQGHASPSVKLTVAFARVMKASPEKIWLAQARYELEVAEADYEGLDDVEITPSEKWS